MSRHKNLLIKYRNNDSVFAWWHYVEVTFRTFSMSPLARSPRRCRQQTDIPPLPIVTTQKHDH